MIRAIATLAIALAIAGMAAPARAQSVCSPEHAAMGHCTLSAPAAPPGPATTPGPQAESARSPGCTAEHAAMGHCTPQGRDAQAPWEPVPVPTDADRAAAFRPLHHPHAHDPGVHSLVLFNRFEAWDADPGSGQAWEGRAWIGDDIDRLWLRSEGEREHGRTRAADIEALYGRAISPWWDLMTGIRHDFNPGPSQTWAAVGIQGLAPYKFEVAATAYLGESGRSMFIAEVEYELLLTNRLVLQPLLEVELQGRDDPRRGLGSGLSSAEAGLRLRYEVTRQFAPYIGVARERAHGDTADLRRQAGEGVGQTRWMAGVRWWF